MSLSLVPDLLARPGHRFTFTGPNPGDECAGCPVQRLCFDLEAGTPYQVTTTRDVTHPCNLHEGRMRVVQVEPTTFESTIETRRLRGTAATYTPIDCGYPECPNWKLCHPVGVAKGIRYQVEAHESVACPMDYRLQRVTLTPL